MAIWFRIGLIAVAFTVSALPADACSCGGGGNRSACQVPVATILVRATVVSKEVERTLQISSQPGPNGLLPLSRPPGLISPPALWGPVKVTLRVLERFRGTGGDTLVIRTGYGDEDCGYSFVVGNEYLVFANESQGVVTVTSCSATQPAKMAMARIEQLRALRDATTLPDLYGFVGTHPLRSGQAGWEEVQPMAGLTVTARSDAAEYRTQTTSDGLYRFSGLARAQYRVSVAAPPGRRAFWGTSTEDPRTGSGTPCAVNFEVFWDGLISGTIVGRDGQPASGMIMAQYVGPETGPTAFLGSYVKDGRYEIQRLPPGRYRLMFSPVATNVASPAGPPVYYPGTLAHDAAVLIGVGEGARVEGLRFTDF